MPGQGHIKARAYTSEERCFMMLTPPSGTTEEVKREYWRWLEERVLRPMKELEPDLYDVLLDVYRGHFAHVVDAVVSRDN